MSFGLWSQRLLVRRMSTFSIGQEDEAGATGQAGEWLVALGVKPLQEASPNLLLSLSLGLPKGMQWEQGTQGKLIRKKNTPI